MVQAAQGQRPGEGEAAAGDHEEVADQSQERRLPGRIPGRDLLHEDDHAEVGVLPSG